VASFDPRNAWGAAFSLLSRFAQVRGLVHLGQRFAHRALNIPRSTAWTIRTGQHKASGLTASIVERMLAAPKLPSATRATLLEYVAEKASGLYGSTGRQRRDIRRKMKERK